VTHEYILRCFVAGVHIFFNPKDCASITSYTSRFRKCNNIRIWHIFTIMQPPFPSPVSTWHNAIYPALDVKARALSHNGKTVVITGAVSHYAELSRSRAHIVKRGVALVAPLLKHLLWRGLLSLCSSDAIRLNWRKLNHSFQVS
jgi:hypothetical protein